MKRTLITGGSGFIGTNLMIDLIKRGHQVLSIDIKKPAFTQHQDNYIYCDILESSHLISIIDNFRPDYVFHLAARTDLGGTLLEDYEVNYTGTLNVVQACNKFKPRRLLYTSTQLVNPISYSPSTEYDVRPPNHYGHSKLLGEAVIRVHSSDIGWTIVRPTTVWGPWFPAMYQGLFRSIMNRSYRHFSNLTIDKRWSYVENATNAMILLADKSNANFSTYYIADKQHYSIEQFADLIAYLSNSPTIKSMPLVSFKILALLGDFLKFSGIYFPLTSYRLKNMMSAMSIHSSMDASLLIDDVISREEAVLRTLHWMKSYYQHPS